MADLCQALRDKECALILVDLNIVSLIVDNSPQAVY